MKVLITATSFSEVAREPEQRLIDAGYEVAHNPYGRPMTVDEVAPLLKGVDGVAAGVDDFSAPALAQADQLKIIAKHGAGVDNIGIEECTRRGIVVANIPGANAEAVADMALALMLAVARHIPEGDRTTKATLERLLKDADGDGLATFRLYEYGVGDEAEIASFAHLEKQADGTWRGTMSPGVKCGW